MVATLGPSRVWSGYSPRPVGGVALLLLLSAVLSASPGATGAIASLGAAAHGHIRWLDARSLAVHQASGRVLSPAMTVLRTSRLARTSRAVGSASNGSSTPSQADVRAGLLTLPPPTRF